MTTLPPTTPPPLNSFYTLYSNSQHRHDKKLDVKPLAVVKGELLFKLTIILFIIVVIVFETHQRMRFWKFYPAKRDRHFREIDKNCFQKD